MSIDVGRTSGYVPTFGTNTVGNRPQLPPATTTTGTERTDSFEGSAENKTKKKGFFAAIAGVIGAVIAGIGGLFNKEKIAGRASKVGNFALNIFKGIGKFITTAFQRISSFFTNTIGSIFKKNSEGQGFRQKVSEFVKGTPDKPGVAEKAIENSKKAVNFVREKTSKVSKFMKEKGVGEKVGKFFKGIGNFFKGLFKKPV